jgi:hypothetical protein
MSDAAPFTENDCAVIRLLAGGDQSRRDQAISIFRSILREKKSYYQHDPYFVFMSEVDNPCPCWVLRSQNRAKILGRPWP